MSFIREMEETEEILKEINGRLGPGQDRERELVANIFTQLKERQMLSSAALQAKDSYDRLKEERSELAEREKRVEKGFGDQGAEGHHYSVGQARASLGSLSTRLGTRWPDLVQALDAVRTALKDLNSSLSQFPSQLQQMQSPLWLENFDWPTHLTTRLTEVTEESFRHIRRVRRTVTKMDEKIEVLEIVLCLPLRLKSLDPVPTDEEADETSEED